MHVVLPDGKSLELPEGANGADLAAAIGPGLARAALGVRVNGKLSDLLDRIQRIDPGQRGVQPDVMERVTIYAR